MAVIQIYSKNICPYCVRAKALLTRKGVSYEEIDIEHSDEKRQEMLTRSGGRTSVPQIFINNQHIGGCDDLYALDQKGGLNPLLGL